MDEFLQIFKENRQDSFLESQEYESLNSFTERMLGIINLLVSLGNGLNKAGNNQELISSYNIALKKLNDYVGSLNLKTLGNDLVQKISQAEKETNPKEAHSNVVFFKRLNKLYKELCKIMLKEKAENSAHCSHDAQEIFTKINTYVDMKSIHQLAHCASFSYTMRHAKDDFNENNPKFSIAKALGSLLNIKEGGAVSTSCHNSLIGVLNGLSRKTSDQKHMADEPGNKRIILDTEYLEESNIQDIQVISSTQVAMPTIG